VCGFPEQSQNCSSSNGGVDVLESGDPENTQLEEELQVRPGFRKKNPLIWWLIL
jgi:hypothetical protein